MTAKGLFLAVQRLAQIPQIDPLFGVVAAELFLRAMEIDRRVVACFAKKLDHPLGLAKGVGANDVASLGLRFDRSEKARDFGL